MLAAVHGHLDLTGPFLSRIKEDYCFQGRHALPRAGQFLAVSISCCTGWTISGQHENSPVRQASVGGSEFAGLP
jgi:hypothetical protein